MQFPSGPSLSGLDGRGLVSRGGACGDAGGAPSPVAIQAGLAGVQNSFEQQGELFQGDTHQLPCDTEERQELNPGTPGHQCVVKLKMGGGAIQLRAGRGPCVTYLQCSGSPANTS